MTVSQNLRGATNKMETTATMEAVQMLNANVAALGEVMFLQVGVMIGIALFVALIVPAVWLRRN